ncbi:uncharacterized protein LOC129739135 [Uranotaenia lowii]|uniref:uncharacterized protein LOC129739135 n=1 Tax=Uranotaenia lowii TaxID=190385 RepID=UPI0024797231|nr:uncharacterized protein LOC129739135 [Uranotaenia lowii]
MFRYKESTMNVYQLARCAEFLLIFVLATVHAVPTGSQRVQSRHLDLDRMHYEQSQFSPSPSEILRNKRTWQLQQITPPGRVRVNDQLRTAFQEMESGELPQEQDSSYVESRQFYPVAVAESRSLQIQPGEDEDIQGVDNNENGFISLLARAARSKDMEDYFYKYAIDSDISASMEDDDEHNDAIDEDGEARFKKKKKFHLKHKYKKFLLPLLLAYKLKFMMLFPAIIGGLVLLVKAAGLAGFFFALFASVVSLQKSH